MLAFSNTPLVLLGNLFPRQQVYAKCEFLAPSGCFKIRGAVHLLEHLKNAGSIPPLIVPSMGNTALGAAEGAKAYGFKMVGVVPTTIAKVKDEKLNALGVELIKIEGGGSDLLKAATEIAKERGGYFVHPHLDPLWTDGYQSILAEAIDSLPNCRTVVFPLGGGGLLMGLLAQLRRQSASVRLIGVEPYNYPKYAEFTHVRGNTIADGLKLEKPHPQVQQAIAEAGITVSMVQETEIRLALKAVFETQGLLVEPSSAVPLAFLKSHAQEIDEPVIVILTGQNIALEDHARILSEA